jgi:hypothetical protein
MKTINSLSGGKTSSYIAVHYPADYNVFALVRTNDIKCMFPDAKIRQIVSDKIGTEFIGTLEEDAIIYTMLDLEQFIGQEIIWVSGITFDDVVNGKFGGVLPNKLRRYCTTQMKLVPIFNWWQKNINKPVEMRIGFRANEMNRANNSLEKLNKNGFLEMKAIIGKSKNGKRNKWGEIEWQKPTFPLIKDAIFKDTIEEFWKDKKVRFAYMNNCVGCFNRNEILLKYMSLKEPIKFQWFIEQEKTRIKKYDTWKQSGHITYDKIKNHKLQLELFDEDFKDCDSGYCGL